MTDDKLLYREQYVFWEMYKTSLSNRRTVIIPMCKIRVGASPQEMHMCLSFTVENRLKNTVSLTRRHCSGKKSHRSSKLQLCHFSVSVTRVITRGQCHHRLQRREGGRCCLEKMKTSLPDPSRVCPCSDTKYNKFTNLLLCEMEGR